MAAVRHWHSRRGQTFGGEDQARTVDQRCAEDRRQELLGQRGGGVIRGRPAEAFSR